MITKNEYVVLEQSDYDNVVYHVYVFDNEKSALEFMDEKQKCEYNNSNINIDRVHYRTMICNSK